MREETIADQSFVRLSAGLRRDVDVLRVLASSESRRRSGLGVVRIAEKLGREKSQVSRALRALEAEGLVERDPRTRTYQLGKILFRLAADSIESRLADAARKRLRTLAETEAVDARLVSLIDGAVTTLLAVIPGSTALPASLTDLSARHAWTTHHEVPDVRSERLRYDNYDDIADGCGPGLDTEPPASPVPGPSWAGFAALVADWSDDAVDAFLSRQGEAVPSAQVHALVSGVRRHGVCTFEDAVAEVEFASPVRDFRNVTAAAVLVTERAGTSRPGSPGALAAAVRHSAQAISADLGWEGR